VQDERKRAERTNEPVEYTAAKMLQSKVWPVTTAAVAAAAAAAVTSATQSSGCTCLGRGRVERVGSRVVGGGTDERAGLGTGSSLFVSVRQTSSRFPRRQKKKKKKKKEKKMRVV
jgi:hypothetical protein